VKDQIADLEELFTTIARYRLKLNPEKCVFGVEASKFLGFLLTERGIEGNPEKCVAIIVMRSPISVNEVQQLTGLMAALFRFVSAEGDKGHPYFQCLKRNNKFIWTKECEESFLKLKEYLATPRYCASHNQALRFGCISQSQIGRSVRSWSRSRIRHKDQYTL